MQSNMKRSKNNEVNFSRQEKSYYEEEDMQRNKDQVMEEIIN